LLAMLLICKYPQITSKNQVPPASYSLLRDSALSKTAGSLSSNKK